MQHHPFIDWLEKMVGTEAARMDGKDVVMTDLGGKRFGLAVYEKMPMFCWHPDDAPALESITWTSAAIAYSVRGRDWFALSATDVRIKDSARLEPLPLRLFVPVTLGRLAVWKLIEPKMAVIGAMKIVKGQFLAPEPAIGSTPWAVGNRELPLKLIGAPDIPAAAPASRQAKREAETPQPKR